MTNKITEKINELKKEMKAIEYEESKKAGIVNWILNGGSENNNIKYSQLSSELKGINFALEMMKEEINKYPVEVILECETEEDVRELKKDIKLKLGEQSVRTQ